MYCLQAVIAAEQVLGSPAGTVTAPRAVPLGQGLALLPMTDEFFDAVTIGSAPRPAGFWKMPGGFDLTLAAWSAHGPIAYVEADFFGGRGEQHAQVWDEGAVVLGPLHLQVNEPFPDTGSPISRALRRLGAAKGDHYDEFEALGLGRCRDTEEWLSL